MCFGGSKGTGGHKGGNSNAEDTAIRKQFTKEGKTARESRAYFRDRDAGKFLSSTTYKDDGSIDTAPKYFKDQTIADVLDPEMYDASKVDTNITFGERKEAGYNKYSKTDMIQARSRFNKFGPGSTNAMQGDVKVTPFDMVDYAKDGTVQGLGPNKTMDERGRGQLVFDPGAAIYGQPSFTDKGALDPKYDKTREGLVGKGLTKFTQGIQDNPFKIIPGFGAALSFIDMFKKDKSEGGGEEVSSKLGASTNVNQASSKLGTSTNVNQASNKRGTRTSVDDYDNMGGLRPDYYDRYLGDTQYDMFGDSAYPSMKSTGDIIGRADQFGEDYLAPKGSLYEPGYIKAGEGIWDNAQYNRRAVRRQEERMLTLSELANTKRGVAMASPNYTEGDEVIIPETKGAIPLKASRFANYVSNNDNNYDNDNDNNLAPVITEPVSADPYTNFTLASTGGIPTLGQSGYGGRYSYGAAAGSLPDSPFYLRYGLTQGAGFNPSVQARYVNPTNQTYFMAPVGLDTNLSDFQLA